MLTSLVAILILTALAFVGINMARTVVETNVLATDRSNNILANSRFQFADNPGELGVRVDISVTSDVAGNDYEVSIDKDFVSLERAIASAAPAILNENPGLSLLVEAGSQVNIDLINNNAGAQDFHTTVEFTPV